MPATRCVRVVVVVAVRFRNLLSKYLAGDDGSMLAGGDEL